MTAAPPVANIEAEQAVLGTVLLTPDVLDRLGALQPEHFFDPVHADVFAACRDRHQSGAHVSAVTMKPALAGHEGLKQLGGIEYLATLATAVVAPSAAPDYAEQIVELYALRQLVSAAQAAIARAGGEDGGVDASAVLEALDDDLDAIRGQTQRRAPSVSLGTALGSAIVRMEKAREEGPGVPTGIAALDKDLGGLYAGDLTVIAGRPGMGKSAVAINVAKRMAERRRAVVFASLEMPAEDIALRMDSDALRTRGRKLAYSSIRRGFVSDEEALDAARAALDLEQLPVHIVSSHVRRLTHILAECRRIVRRIRNRQQEIGAVVVDHIGLVQVQQALSETHRITQITGALKGFAMEHGVPVIALSQLNRQVEARDDKRPRLADLRDSGSIEQDADNVLFCYRPEYYLEREEPDADADEGRALPAWEAKLAKVRGLLEIGIAKQRNGPVSTVRVGCDLACNYLYDWGIEDRGFEDERGQMAAGF